MRRGWHWWTHGMGMSLPARAACCVLALLVLLVDSTRWWVDVPVGAVFIVCLPSKNDLSRGRSGQS